MIAAIQMEWLGVGVAALVVAAALIVVLVRHRGEDERLMESAPVAQTDPQAGPPPGWTSLATAAAGPEPAPAAPVMPAPLASVPSATATVAPPAGAPATARPATDASATSAPIVPPAPLAPVAAAPSAPVAAPPAPATTGSFLDEPLSRGFESLGKRTVPEPPATPGPFTVDPFGSHDDIFPPSAEEPSAEEPVAEEPSAEEPVAEEPVAGAPVEEAPAAEAPAAEAPAATPPEAAVEAAAPLSDVIVTSGSGQVDLADPGVRALLVSLVDDEIALAKACRGQGQTLDAILQLTEAEKACGALGLNDRLAEVKALLTELQG